MSQHTFGKGNNGRTQKMIDLIVAEVSAGKTKTIFVSSYSMDFSCNHIRPRIIDCLEISGVHVDWTCHDVTEVNGVKIHFTPEELMKDRTRGYRNFSIYRDHSIWGKT